MIGRLRSELYAGKTSIGCWLNLGSPMAAEVVTSAGFDWLLIDAEHGPGGFADVSHQILAVGYYGASPIVRVAANEAYLIKKVLDLGPVGVMVPLVNTAEDAARAVAAMRYPPEGVRGVAGCTRATRFGATFDDYFSRASRELLTIVQIETPEAVRNITQIAAVEGVDVVFVGLLDLTSSIGKPWDLEAAELRDSLERIEEAVQGAGKILGTLVCEPEPAAQFIERGYRFVGVGTDGGLLAEGAHKLRQMFP